MTCIRPSLPWDFPIEREYKSGGVKADQIWFDDIFVYPKPSMEHQSDPHSCVNCAYHLGRQFCKIKEFVGMMSHTTYYFEGGYSLPMPGQVPVYRTKWILRYKCEKSGGFTKPIECPNWRLHPKWQSEHREWLHNGDTEVLL